MVTTLIGRARALAVRASDGLTSDGAPRVVHCAETVGVLREFGINDPVTLAAGWLHDVLEDTTATEADVSGIASAVQDLVVRDIVVTFGDDYSTIRAAGSPAVAIAVAARIASVRHALGAGTTSRLALYVRDYPDFDAALYKPNETNELECMWHELDDLMSHAKRGGEAT